MRFRYQYRSLRRTFLSVFICSCLTGTLTSQSSSQPLQVSLDRGIRFDAPDSSLGLKLGLRLQTQFYSTWSIEKEERSEVQSQAYTQLRRVRLLYKGYLLKEEVTYFVQHQFDRGKSSVSDATLEWHPSQAQTFGFGQFRVFEGRQFRISSSCLQLVERATVSNYFTHGYDLGAYWTGSWVPAGSPGVNFYISATRGERLNVPAAHGGYLYTGRVELLPFGSFERKGDYSDGALLFQPGPKLSVGLAVSLNQDAYLLYGEQYPGRENTGIKTMFADYIFKYGHFSSIGEFAWRDAGNQLLVPEGGEPVLSKVVSGSGFFLQMGYLTAPRMEMATRFETIRPEEYDETAGIINKREDRYTAGVTYYIHNHNLKLQGSITFVDDQEMEVNGHTRYLESRFQFQLNF